MPKVEFNDKKGVVQSAGSGVVFKSAITQDQTPGLAAQDKGDAAVTITAGGLYNLSRAGATTVTLPSAADVAGQMFIFRSTDSTPRAHILTGSGGDSVIAPPQANAAGLSRAAAKVTFPTDDASGASIVIVSDGSKFQVVAASGSFTAANYPA
jgi:hypothetical protein